jgi:hypothetical protein
MYILIQYSFKIGNMVTVRNSDMSDILKIVGVFTNENYTRKCITTVHIY